MIPAILLLTLGIADWLTTRAILAKPGGEEKNPYARKMMDHIGVTPFLAGKAVFMGATGWGCSYFAGTSLDWAQWLWVPVAVWYAGFMVKNVRVMRRL